MASESLENYLETILVLSKSEEPVKGADIARALKFSRPSVSAALRKLAAEGLVSVDGRSRVRLTDRGLAVAGPVYERHCVLARALMALGVREEVAYADACRIEHAISEESYQAVRKRLNSKGGLAPGPAAEPS